MSAFETVILEASESLGELRIYPTWVAVQYEGQSFTAVGSLLSLFRSLLIETNWDGYSVRIKHLRGCEGIEVLVFPTQDLLNEKARVIVFVCNKYVLLKRLKKVFAANN